MNVRPPKKNIKNIPRTKTNSMFGPLSCSWVIKLFKMKIVLEKRIKIKIPSESGHRRSSAVANDGPSSKLPVSSSPRVVMFTSVPAAASSVSGANVGASSKLGFTINSCYNFEGSITIFNSRSFGRSITGELREVLNRTYPQV